MALAGVGEEAEKQGTQRAPGMPAHNLERSGKLQAGRVPSQAVRRAGASEWSGSMRRENRASWPAAIERPW